MNICFKYRVYPNKAQKKKIAEFFGCCRFVYNRCLEIRKDTYEKEKRDVGKYELMKIVTGMRNSEETPWLKDCDSMALQEAVKDLDKAYKSFFDKKTGFPQFRCRGDGFQAYRTRNQGNHVRIEDAKHIVLPKIGILKAKVSRPVKGRILNATVSRTCTDKYFVSLCCEAEPEFALLEGGKIGIDVGLKDFYSDSNGGKAKSPKTLILFEKRLEREQRKFSRMIRANILDKDSKGRPSFKRPLSECVNISKQRKKLASIHERIRNIRNDYLHKLSASIVSNNSLIAVEDLNIKGLLKNHHLSKAISDASWGEFINMLEYKAAWKGKRVVKVPTFYPSSQLCSNCGYRNSDLKNLSIRKWTCPRCGMTHDRDMNAALNILDKALESVS